MNWLKSPLRFRSLCRLYGYWRICVICVDYSPAAVCAISGRSTDWNGIVADGSGATWDGLESASEVLRKKDVLVRWAALVRLVSCARSGGSCEGRVVSFLKRFCFGVCLKSIGTKGSDYGDGMKPRDRGDGDVVDWERSLQCKLPSCIVG